jgi:outer membrane immunogenic protein
MRQLVPMFLLMATLTTTARAQDSAAPQQSSTTRSQSGGYGGYDGYGGRAEVFVNGFGVFGNGTSGNAITQQETQSGGASVGYRFHLNAASALEGRYGFSRDSQKFTIGGTGGTVSSVPSYLSEISASYVYSLPKSRHLQPFLEGGGGLLIFSPGNYGGASVTTANSIYGGNSSGLQTQAKGMFAYGGGADVPVMSRVTFRIEVRGITYKTPDFGSVTFQTNSFSFLYEPSLGVAYHF